MAVECSIDLGDVEDLFTPTNYRKMAETVVGEALIKLTDYVVDEAPKKDGKLKESIDSEIDKENPLTGTVFSEGCPYIKHVIYGTKPHIILPKNKKALYWEGAEHPVRRVKHPGTKPNNFPERAVKKFNDSGFVERRISHYTDKWKRKGRSSRQKSPGTFIGLGGRKMGAGKHGGFW